MSRSRLFGAVVVMAAALICLWFTSSALAGGWTYELQQEIADGDGQPDDLYGFSLSIFGNWLVVGSKSADSEDFEDTGAVFLYRLDHRTGDWIFTQKIIPDEAVRRDEFGESVCLLFDRLVVGARAATEEEGSGYGSAYVYRLNYARMQWEFEQKIEGEFEDEFGRSVALSPVGGLWLFVGARFAEVTNQQDPGAVYAYLYDRKTKQWQLQQKIVPDDGGSRDEFGRAIDTGILSCGRLAVGSRRADNIGKVYIYRLDTRNRQWVLEEKLTVSDGENNDRFGQSVSLYLNSLAVGARDADSDGVDDTGAVYSFKKKPAKGGWIVQQKIMPPDGAEGDQFGFCVEMLDNLMVVGARRTDTTGVGVDTGAVYVYRKNVRSGLWEFNQKIVLDEPVANDEFGQSIGISMFGPWRLVVGADQIGDSVGAAYIYGR